MIDDRIRKRGNDNHTPHFRELTFDELLSRKRKKMEEGWDEEEK